LYCQNQVRMNICDVTEFRSVVLWRFRLFE
jgi:hypothetical protein